MADDEAQREVAAAALSGETDYFVLAKAAARASLALVINTMLKGWEAEARERRAKLQDALIATLADLTAECALGMRVPTKEQFLQFMGRSYDKVVGEQGKPP